MLYQLNRPFAHPIYFDIPAAPVQDILPLWFGPSWQPLDPSARASAKPLLSIASDDPTPLTHIHNFVREHTVCQDPYFIFHGGAVTCGQDAYVFLAATTTGKTTLITYLSQIGYTYLNDDSFAIDMNTLQIPPYSSPIHLRDGGFAYLKSVLPEPLPPCAYIDAELSFRHILFPEKRTSQFTNVKKIFFLNRTDDPAADDSCTPLPAFQSLQRLFISALVPYQMSKRHIQFFQRLTPLCHQLTYHDAADAARLLNKIISGQEVQHV